MESTVTMKGQYIPPSGVEVRAIENQQEKYATIRVAAYCRVSTDMEIQETSLDTQIAAFSKIISERPGWTLAGIYADKGISGTTVKHREEFKRMIADAKAGKIDYIIAKSISRFARNTVDTLAFVRELKSYGVSVFFEKEKLDTGNAVSEFLLSIFAAAAQEEIISLSNNMKVGRRMRYASGVVQWTHVYGFRKGENGDWLVEEDEAKVVRRIFDEYAAGRSLPEICKGLEADGIPSTGSKTHWYPTSMATLLHNEKYVGDLRMQKSYISDPIQHVKVNNKDAKLKQYYVENHHSAIVPRETYEMVQMVSAMRDMHRGATQYPFYGFLKCPICGANMVRFAHPRNNYITAWTCAGKPSKKGDLRKHRTACPPYCIIEDYIEQAFWDALRAVDKQALKDMAASCSSEKAALAAQMLDLKQKTLFKGRNIEYKMLRDLVEKISFPQWATMRIDWKVGLASEAHIDYKKLSDMPYPSITREEVEHTTTKGTIKSLAYVVNGEPVFKGCPDRQVEGLRHAQEEVLNLTILEARNYEPPVPRVFGTKTCCDLGGVERAAENKAKRGRRCKKNAPEQAE